MHQEWGWPEAATPNTMALDSTLNQGRPCPMDSPDPAVLPRLLTCSHISCRAQSHCPQPPVPPLPWSDLGEVLGKVENITSPL